MSTGEQLEFNFPAAGDTDDGLSVWRKQRRVALDQLAKQVGLPLGRCVEVRLVSGVILRGVLRLSGDRIPPDATRTANLDLSVNGVSFRHSEIEACVVQD